MRILIAEDDPVSRRLLEATLKRWGHEPVLTSTGTEAWDLLQSEGGPDLAILDWMMPGMDGIEVCRRLRASARTRPLYVIILTARSDRDDLVMGLDAGADDYVTKPFDQAELRARVAVGVRVLELQTALAERVIQLEDALAHVTQLRGLLPICSYCKKVRSDRDYWEQIEVYVSKHSDARFSHGVCPECLEKAMREL